jgi:hypothetical protein
MAHPSGRPEPRSPVPPPPAGGWNVAQRGAQPQDGGTETVWCSTCRRDHPMVRCVRCGAELPSDFLIRMCKSCKAALRKQRASESR